MIRFEGCTQGSIVVIQQPWDKIHANYFFNVAVPAGPTTCRNIANIEID